VGIISGKRTPEEEDQVFVDQVLIIPVSVASVFVVPDPSVKGGLRGVWFQVLELVAPVFVVSKLTTQLTIRDWLISDLRVRRNQNDHPVEKYSVFGLQVVSVPVSAITSQR
jgi:hypothetical protein